MHFLLACAALVPALAVGQAVAAGAFDGLYQGEGTLRSGRCARPENPRFRVADNHISRPLGGSGAQIEADVGPDGTVRNAAGAVRTTTIGSITGTALTLDVTTPACTLHYALMKTP